MMPSFLKLKLENTEAVEGVCVCVCVRESLEG